MHNDEPTLLDALERGALVKEVGDAVAHCVPPQVFGVHGAWGLGKTSFLHQVQWYLAGACPQQSESATKEVAQSQQIESGAHAQAVRAVWFDAWRYQHEPAPIVALLQEMRAQLSWRNQVTGSVTRTMEVATRGALLSLEELTKKIGFQYSRFREASQEWEAENLATALPSHTLREQLSAAVGKLLPRRKRNGMSPRLVVFIDDIDRCEPRAAYSLLEGLKIYLNLDNCVFVMGMNQKAIEEAIASQMGTGDDAAIRATAYMEKLCQNVWRLPAVRNPSQVLYHLLEKTVANPTVRGWIRRVVEERPCLPPNPRKLKGFANLIGRMYSKLPNQNGAPDDPKAIDQTRLLVVVAYIYQFHHDLYVRWEAESGLFEKIRDWCEGDPSDKPFLNSLVLPQMKLPQGENGTETSSLTPEITYESTYPDPAEANVFWIQPLILRLGLEVTSGHFERYLHREVTT